MSWQYPFLVYLECAKGGHSNITSCQRFIQRSFVLTVSMTRSSSILNLWSRVTHICISKPTIIGLHYGLLPGRYQAIIWTNAEILLIGKLQWNLNRNSYIFIHENAFQNVVWKMVAISPRPQCIDIHVCEFILTLYLISVLPLQFQHYTQRRVKN